MTPITLSGLQSNKKCYLRLNEDHIIVGQEEISYAKWSYKEINVSFEPSQDVVILESKAEKTSHSFVVFHDKLTLFHEVLNKYVSCND